MTRIAAGVLVLGAVLAMSGMFPQRLAAAEAQPPASVFGTAPATEARVIAEDRGTRVIALLMTLGALRAAPVPAAR
jgi:hypothetical protein